MWSLKEHVPKGMVSRKKGQPVKINEKKLMQYMSKANQWVRELEYFCDWPSGDTEEEKSKVEYNPKDEDDKHKKKRPVLNVNKRLRGLTEIEEKLNEIRGKKMANINEARYKKNLKTRLTKQQKKEKRRLLKAKNKNKGNLLKRDVGLSKPNESETAMEETVKDEKSSEKILFNKEDKMVFNKIDFSGVGKEKPNKKSKMKQEKDPKFLLEELKKTNSKLTELKQSGESDKANVLKEKQMWTTALKKAEGVKVKDDVSLLKKTLRKQKEVKNRQQKKWEKRVQVIEQKKEERQKKRQENIAARKKEIKKNKIKRSVNKGRVVL